MATVKYTLPIPASDNDVAGATHHWIKSGPLPAITYSYIHRGVHSVGGLSDHVVVFGDDSPELDSHIKQVAHHVAEVINHPHLNVIKEGNKSGIQNWVIKNLKHSPWELK